MRKHPEGQMWPPFKQPAGRGGPLEGLHRMCGASISGIFSPSPPPLPPSCGRLSSSSSRKNREEEFGALSISRIMSV